MAIKTKVTEVGETPTVMLNADTDITVEQWAKLYNASSDSVFIGNATVTPETGLEVKSHEYSPELLLKAKEILYGIGASTIVPVVVSVDKTHAITAMSDNGSCAITSISGDGTTVTFVGANNYAPGDVVTIVGATEPTFNLVGATVNNASNTQFTILNVATGTTSTAKCHTVGKLNLVTYLLDNLWNLGETSNQEFEVGEVVSITGATDTQYNLVSATIYAVSPTQIQFQATLSGVDNGGNTASVNLDVNIDVPLLDAITGLQTDTAETFLTVKAIQTHA